MALIVGANLNDAFNAAGQGFSMGLVTGGIAGASAAYANSVKNGVNAFNGSVKNEVLIGGNQSRVDNMASKMSMETINDNKVSKCPSDLDPYLSRNNPNPKALDFNQKWINEIIKSNYRIYDAGRPNGYSPYYHGIELNTIQTHNYNNVYQTKSFFNNNLIFNYKL